MPPSERVLCEDRVKNGFVPQVLCEAPGSFVALLRSSYPISHGIIAVSFVRLRTPNAAGSTRHAGL